MEDFDDEEWAEMQKMYINHTCKELEKINAELNLASIDSIRTFGHNIKGSGGMYGFDEVTDLGLQIETAAKERDLDSIKSNLKHLEDFLQSKI
tara:strand:- start:1853 stop:2131 length:279 start_codon:yes stop_codon:yes gene_type:complete